MSMLKEQNETNANNLSIKLLKTLGGPVRIEGDGNKVITNLKDLSNRIKIANRQHENKHANRVTTDQWIREEGIDLAVVKDQARYTKEEEKKLSIRIQKPIEEEVTPLKQTLKDLQFPEFLEKAEENFAYRAIFESMTKQTNEIDSYVKTQSHMRRLIMKNITWVSGMQESAKRPATSRAIEKISQADALKFYQKCVEEGLASELYVNLFNQFQSSDDKSKLWITLIYHQVEMAKHISGSVDSEESKRNYFSAVSIEVLQQIFSRLCERNMTDLMAKYRTEQNGHSYDVENWGELYFMLRRGDREGFLRQCGKKEMVLMELFEGVLQSIDKFQRPPMKMTEVVVTPRMCLFQRIIKLAALGKYQNVFGNLPPWLQALEEAWLILMTLNFSGGASLQQKQRKLTLKTVLGDYFKKMSAKIYRQNFDEQTFMHVALGLLSLGSFQQIFILFDKYQQSLESSALRMDVMHLFIVLAANPALLYGQLSPGEANKALKRCLNEIIHFLKQLKIKYSESFRTYFGLLLSILVGIEREELNFCLDELVEVLCEQLITSYEDLTLIGYEDVIKLIQGSQVVSFFQKRVIKGIIPFSEKEFLGLARICTQAKQFKLREEVLIKMIIWSYFEGERQFGGVQSVSFGERAVQRQPFLSENLRKVQLFLQQVMQDDSKQILHFLQDLIELRNLVIRRRKDLLRNDEKRFSSYRWNFEKILEYLTQMDPSYRSGLLEIFVLYYQRLCEMYRLIYLSSSSLDKFHAERSRLQGELRLLGRRYPAIESQAFERVMQLLCK